MTALGTLLCRHPLRRRRRASGAVGPRLTFPTTPLGIRVALALGADPAADPTTDFSWTDITEFVMLADGGITIHRGRADEQTRVAPSWCTLQVDNADGRFSRLNPVGEYYGTLRKNTPIRVQVNPGTGWVTRFVGFVSEWPPRWTHGQLHQWVPVRADGVLRRLGQAPATVRSAARRSLTSTNSDLNASLIAYWPIEEPETATAASSPLVGVSRGTVPVPARARFGQSGPGGSAGAAQLVTGDPVLGSLHDNRPALSLPVPEHTAGQLVWAFWFRGDVFQETAGANATADSSAVVSSWLNFSDGTIGSVRVNLVETVPGTASRQSYVAVIPNTLPDVAGIDLTEINTFPAGPRIFDGAWHQVQVRLAQSGGDVATSVYLDGVLYDSATETTQTLGVASVVKLATSGSVTNGTPVTDTGSATFQCSTVTVHNATAVNVTDLYDAGTGYAGETDVDRFNRICEEEGIPHVTATGSGLALGPQPLVDTLAILRDGEAAGQGVLYEAFDGRLAYQPLRARYNLPVTLALDIDQGHIVAPFEPTDDDLLTRDDITVTNVNTGVSAHVTDEDSIAAVGRVKEGLTLNLDVDDQAEQVASWRRWVGGDHGYRYPTVMLALHKPASLVTDWLACDLGSRLTIDNMPADVTPNLVDQVIEGYTERISSIAYDVGINQVPDEPLDIGTYESSSNDKRYDTLLTTTAEALDTTETGVNITNAGSVHWGTVTPYVVDIGGEWMAVTAVSGTGASQTLTVTRSVNGVVKSHTSGAQVRIAPPYRAYRGL